MKKSTLTLALTLALAASVSACGEDATMSDEYQALEQQLSDTTTELTEALAALDERADAAVGSSEVPGEVVAVLDEWWAANERNDGSVVDLYMPTGYHVYGAQKISLDGLADHLSGSPNMTHEWISEPYLIAAEPEGRYVVTRGVRNSFGSSSSASALTFEILTIEGELKIAETDWTHAH
jgi:hypothetical protein